MQISTDNFIPDSAPLKPSLFLGVWIIRRTSKVMPYLNTWGFPTLYTKIVPQKNSRSKPLVFWLYSFWNSQSTFAQYFGTPPDLGWNFTAITKMKKLNSPDRSPFSNCQQVESLSRLLWLAYQSLHH